MSAIKADGLKQTYTLLREVGARAADTSPAWNLVADDVFDFEREFWLTAYGSKTDKDRRPGRNPKYMHQTGTLEAAATVRGAGQQQVKATGGYLMIEVTAFLAAIQEARGREVLAEPGAAQVDSYAERVADYILTGSL